MKELRYEMGASCYKGPTLENPTTYYFKTDCPYIKNKKVGSKWCEDCDFFVENNKSMLTVKCKFEDKIKNKGGNMNKQTYSIGDKFKVEGQEQEYVLAQVDKGKVALIGLETWDRYSSPLKVNKVHRITQNELFGIAGDDDLKLRKKEGIRFVINLSMKKVLG